MAIAIASLINALSPEIIVLAGGITTAGDALFQPLHEFIELFEFRPKGKTTLIKQAKFADLSGAIGAAAFVFGRV